MFASRRNGDGIADLYLASLAVNADAASAVGDVINLLRPDMIMFLRAAAGGQARFGQALVADGGIAMRKPLADFPAVFGGKRRDFVEIFYIHKTDYPQWPGAGS